MGEVQLADGETIKTSPDVVQITPVVRGFALTLSVVAILIALSFGIWTAVHKNSRVVRASQPVFLQLIVLGVVVFTSGAIPTASIDFVSASNEAAAAVCTAHLWLLALGTGITLGAMQAKLYRINKIVQSATKFKRIKVTAGDAIKPTIAITSGKLVVDSKISCMNMDNLTSVLANFSLRSDRNHSWMHVVH